MNAQTLHCQSCGAAVSSEAPVCEHCGARLASICCPNCFGMMFRDMKFCPHCGALAVPWESTPTEMPCPACGAPLLVGRVGDHRLHECDKCFGMWLDSATFEQICRQAEQQASVLLGGHLGEASARPLEPVRYRPCPVCHQLMNRMNFAQCSGVIVDLCQEHGTWFDKDELQRIVEFIRGGGLDRVREQRKDELATQARRVEALRRGPDWEGLPEGRRPLHADLLTMVVGSVGSLLGRRLR